MIVLDASVLIAHLDSGDALHRRATALLLDAGTEPFAASWLTLAEVLVGPARAGTTKVATAALEQLGVEGLGLDEEAPARLASLRAETGLKLPDCCVLLAAAEGGADLASFDARLAATARARGLVVRD